MLNESPAVETLDESALVEIEARPARAGYYDAQYPFVPMFESERDALCQSLRAAWKKITQLERDAEAERLHLNRKQSFLVGVQVRLAQAESANAALRDQLAQLTTTVERRAGKYCDRPEDMPPTAIINIGFNVLESRLAQVEKERDDLRRQIR